MTVNFGSGNGDEHFSAEFLKYNLKPTSKEKAMFTDIQVMFEDFLAEKFHDMDVNGFYLFTYDKGARRSMVKEMDTSFLFHERRDVIEDCIFRLSDGVKIHQGAIPEDGCKIKDSIGWSVTDILKQNKGYPEGEEDLYSDCSLVIKYLHKMLQRSREFDFASKFLGSESHLSLLASSESKVEKMRYEALDQVPNDDGMHFEPITDEEVDKVMSPAGKYSKSPGIDSGFVDDDRESPASLDEARSVDHYQDPKTPDFDQSFCFVSPHSSPQRPSSNARTRNDSLSDGIDYDLFKAKSGDREKGK